MKKYKSRLFFCILGLMIFICLVAFLNVKVTTKQGVYGQVRIIRIPLYLKILDFYDRHYNYQWVVNRIIKDTDSDSERAFKLFKWTCDNIRKAPEGYPIIDDHVWHIIIRGYGVSDQSSDVFSTLCNYAGLDSFFMSIGAKRMPLSFVKLKNKWCVFDPYRGTYFKDEKGNIADVDTLRFANWNTEYLKEKPSIDYAELFHSLPVIEKTGLTRANIQSPLNRFLFEINKFIKRQRVPQNLQHY